MTAGMTATGSLDGGRTGLAPFNPADRNAPGTDGGHTGRDRPGSCRCPRSGAGDARVTAVAAIILLVALAVASGPLDPRYQVLGGPFDLRGRGGALLVVNQLAPAATTLAVVVGAASLVVRFRRAGGVERQQLGWVAWAAALAVVDQTMQPIQASLWLRQGPPNGLAAAVGPGTHHQEQAT
jgi:hypothetical protein